jgi:hypothetical protein
MHLATFYIRSFFCKNRLVTLIRIYIPAKHSIREKSILWKCLADQTQYDQIYVRQYDLLWL